MEKGKKRKRDTEIPRITYHAATKTFDRLFKEESLAEMKEVVRRKLGLSDATHISLAQIREGKSIDLDDDDDFDAFHVAAHSLTIINVQVSVHSDLLAPNPPVLTEKRIPNTLAIPEELDGEQQSLGHMTGSSVTPEEVLPTISTLINQDTLDITKKPPKKKRKKAVHEVASNPNSEEIVIPVSSLDVTKEPVHNEEQTDVASITFSAQEKESPVSISKNARHRKKQNIPEAQVTTLSEPIHEVELAPSTTKQAATQKSDQRKSTKSRKVPFAQQLAGAISETSAANRKNSEDLSGSNKARSNIQSKGKRQSLESTYTSGPAGKVNDTQENKSSISNRTKQRMQKKAYDTEAENESTNSATQRLKSNSKTSEVDELEADVKAAGSRILAARRALLSNLSMQISSTHEPESISTRLNGEAHGLDRIPQMAPLETCENERDPILEELSINSKSIQDRSSSPLHAQDEGLVSSTRPESVNAVPIRPLSLNRKVTAPDQYNVPPEVYSSSSSANSSPVQKRTSNATRHDGSNMMSLALGSTYADINLEALIRGPQGSFSIADVTSAETSEAEQELSLEEDDDERHRSRRSKRGKAFDSSDDDIDDDSSVETGGEDNGRLSLMAEPPLSNHHSHPISFETINKLGESQEIDKSGDVAFKRAFDEDVTIYEPANEGGSTTSSQPNHGNKPDSSNINVINNTVQETSRCVDTSRNTLMVNDSHTGGPCAPTHAVPDTNLKSDGITQKTKGRKKKPPVEAALVGSVEPSTSGTGLENQDSIAKRTRTATRMSMRIFKASTKPQLSESVHESTPLSPGTSVNDDKVHRSQVGNGIPSPTPVQSIDKNINEENSTMALQTPTPLDTWTTLKVSSPIPDPDSTIMIDELQSSSPAPGFQMDDAADVPPPETGDVGQSPLPKDPLFILTESQPPFPYSQWNEVDLSEGNKLASNDSDEEEEVENTMQSQSRTSSASGLPPYHKLANVAHRRSQSQTSSASGLAPYRKLTDIARQHSMFSTPSNSLPAPTKRKLTNMYGWLGEKKEDDSDSNTSSDSGSDTQDKSHFPASRRAGIIGKNT